MEKTCSKCETIMVEAVLDSHPIKLYRTDVKANAKTMSFINPCYVCPNCGFIDFYVTEPEKFRE